MNNPKLWFYHLNEAGDGSAASFEVRPASVKDSGALIITIKSQTNHLSNSIELNFYEVCLLLEVLRGVTDSINDRSGIQHDEGQVTKHLKLWTNVASVTPYFLAVSEADNVAYTEHGAYIKLSNAEAVGLEAALSGCMHLIAFGL